MWIKQERTMSRVDLYFSSSSSSQRPAAADRSDIACPFITRKVSVTFSILAILSPESKSIPVDLGCTLHTAVAADHTLVAAEDNHRNCQNPHISIVFPKS